MSISNNIPLISIVITTYNRAAYIAETIQSIRVQTFNNWELLIMDNGSEDNTQKIVQSFADNRIQYQYHTPTNTGKLRNIAFRLAKGEYIALMDSDDLWLPDKLEQQWVLLQTNPQIKLSFTNSYDFIGDKEIIAPYNPSITGTEIRNVFDDFIENRLKPTIQSFLFHKSCLGIAGWFYEMRVFNDYRFIGCMVHHFDAAIIHEPLLLRRLHNANSVDVYAKELADEYIEAITVFYKNKWLTKQQAIAKIFTTYVNGGNTLLNEKKWIQAIILFFKAWKAAPLSVIPFKKITKTIFRYLLYQLSFDKK